MMPNNTSSIHQPAKQYAAQLKFMCGKYLHSIEELKKLAKRMPQYGFEPAERVDNELAPLSSSIVIDSAFIDFEKENTGYGGLLRGCMIPLISVGSSQDISAVFNWSVFEDGCNQIGVIVVVNEDGNMEDHNKLGNHMYPFACFIDSVMEPVYGIICDPEYEDPSMLSAPGVKVPKMPS